MNSKRSVMPVETLSQDGVRLSFGPAKVPSVKLSCIPEVLPDGKAVLLRHDR